MELPNRRSILHRHHAGSPILGGWELDPLRGSPRADHPILASSLRGDRVGHMGCGPSPSPTVDGSVSGSVIVGQRARPNHLPRTARLRGTAVLESWRGLPPGRDGVCSSPSGGSPMAMTSESGTKSRWAACTWSPWELQAGAW